MNMNKTSTQIKALGLCSGGLDSILSALVLRDQGIDVTWICFETPFFSSESAKKAASMTGIELITLDITEQYMEMMQNPRAGFGKNMNPCMDCHALMFSTAGRLVENGNFHFLFSGEVLGQRPKSQNRNSLRYVEKNSGLEGLILRPLSAKLLNETLVEKQGLVQREKLLDISGRSRKIQTELAKKFGITDYPSPAGGCLLTDRAFSTRLKDLMYVQKNFEKRELFFLKYGRHFRLDKRTKVIVGRSRAENIKLGKIADRSKDIIIKHAKMPGPDVILTGAGTMENIRAAAIICASYTKADTGAICEMKISDADTQSFIRVQAGAAEQFRASMI
jgi:tRNA U34 2-thiouridine synthase MnmA/TrmU